MTRSPQLSDVFNTYIELALEDVHVSMPGRVLSYDKSSRRATVKPLVKRSRTVDDQLVTEALKAIPDVPVVFPGLGPYGLSWPVNAGDTVLLVFASCSLERWLTGNGAEVDPQNPRRHKLGDAMAIPGLRAFGDPADDPAHGNPDADLIIESDGNIVAGGNNRLVTKAEFDTHVHPDPASGLTGAPTVAAVGTNKLRG